MDSDIDDVRNLNPVNGSSGELSKKAKDRVMPHILDFVHVGMGYVLDLWCSDEDSCG